MKSWSPPLLVAILAFPCWASELAISTSSLPGGTVATSYSAVIKASGGCTPYTWKLLSGSLPAGVAKQTSTTTVSLNLYGTPTAAATYYPTISVTGCGGYISKKSYKIVIQSSGNVAISTPSLPNGMAQTSYSAIIKASGGCTPYTWKLVSGSLPAGVAKQTSTNTTSLNLYGTPTIASTYYPTISVTGCGGNVSKVSYKIVIQSSGSVAISTLSLPNGMVKTAYSAAIKASGGCTPYTWNLVSGSLPAGVTKQVSSDTTSLKLYGTPTTVATYSPSISVSGCGSVSQRSYHVVIQSIANHIVDLKWNPSTSANVAGYNVYRGPDGNTWKKINVALVASTLYTDSTVASSTTYYYATTAVDVYGRESSKTAGVRAIIP
jgi:hypothetical protein